MRFCLAWLVLSFCGALCARGASVALSWQDNSSNETSFRIERAEGLTAPFSFLASVATNSTAYRDEDVVAGRTYRYRVQAGNAAGFSGYSNTAQATVATPGALPNGIPSNVTAQAEGTLANVSARGKVTNGADTLIPGLVVANGPARALVRVLGPTWGTMFEVPGACPDPVFEIRNQANSAVVVTNDNWSGADVVQATLDLNIFALPAGSKDAAVVVNLPPGAYTIVVRGVGGVEGVVLAEVYQIK